MAEKKQKKDKTTDGDPRVVSKSPEEDSGVGDITGLPFDLSKVDPKTLAKADTMLEGTGFSIQKLADWANEQHVKTEFIIKNMPTDETVEKALQKTLNKMAQQAAARQQQIIAQGGGGQSGLGGAGGLIQMLPQLLGSSGQDEDMKNLQKQMFQVNIDNMKANMGMAQAITNAVVQKITAKAIGDTVTELVNK